jgi:hypothetical protein
MTLKRHKCRAPQAGTPGAAWHCRRSAGLQPALTAAEPPTFRWTENIVSRLQAGAPVFRNCVAAVSSCTPMERGGGIWTRFLPPDQVAQVGNLRYRRFAIGGLSGRPLLLACSTPCGFPIRETADGQSALLQEPCPDAPGSNLSISAIRSAVSRKTGRFSNLGHETRPYARVLGPKAHELTPKAHELGL